MANLSNINNKFLVTTGGNVLIGQTAVVGTSVLQAEGGTNAIIRMNSTSGTGGRMDFAHGGSNYGNVGSARNMLGVGNATDMMVNGDNILYLGVGAQHMTILSSGKVGIGTALPNALLNLSQAAGANIRFDNETTTNYFTIGEGVGTNNVFSFRGNSYRSTDTMSIDFVNDRVGIGTISPVTKLELKGLIAGSVTNDRETTTSSFVINGITENMSLQFGLGGSALNYGNWIQSGYDNGVPTAASLYLNPIGGPVGIGTTSPQDKLEVKSGYIRLYDPSSNINAGYPVRWSSNNGGTNVTFANISGVTTSAGNRTGDIYFSTSNAGAPTEKMRIDSSGNVTIGSSALTGSRSLTLLSATNATTYDINFQQAGTTNFGRIRFTEGASDFQFIPQVGQGPNLTLQYGGNSFFSRGNVGIGMTSPDYGKLQIDQTSGNNLTLRKGTGFAAIAFGGVTNNEATFLIEGNASQGFRVYNGTGTLASPTWTAGMDFFDQGRLHPYGGVFLGSSNNSNLLNYYASGIWTPTVTTSQGTNPTISPTPTGRWQRVGKVVTASFEFKMSNPTVGAGSVIINNLPIAIADTNHVSGCGVIPDLGKTINVRHYTATDQIAMNFYDGNYCGTAFRTVGTVTYWAAT